MKAFLSTSALKSSITLGVMVIASTLSGIASAAEAAKESKLEFPLSLRLPILGQFGQRYVLLDRQGHLLHEPDVSNISNFRPLGEKVMPVPAKSVKELWGYMDLQGKWVIEPQYLEARSFSEDGMARVKTKTGWGFLGADLKLVIPAKFEEVQGMRAGRAAFKKGGKWGFLDTQGQVVIPPRFTEVSYFDDGGLAAVSVGEKHGFIDKQGKEVVAIRFDRAGPFGANGLARVALKEKWGYVNRQGALAVPIRYDLALDFESNEVAPVEEKDKWGLLNSKGEWVLKPTYSHIDEVQAGGLAAVRDSSFNTGFIDMRGKLVVPIQRGIGRHVSGGLIRQGGEGDSSVSYLDLNGKLAIKGPFDWGSHFNSQGFAVARQKGKWGILSRQGGFTPMPRHIEPYSNGGDGYVGFDEEGYSPWITTDRAIEWLDGSGKTRFRLEQGPGSKPKLNSLRLSNDKGVVLWENKAVDGQLASHPYFDPSPLDLLSDPADMTQIVAKAQALLKAAPRPFVALQGWDRDRDPYEMPEDSDEIEDNLRHGAISNLVIDYVSEESWGGYYFLDEQRSGQVKTLYKSLKAQLDKAFGPAVAKPEAEDSLANGDGGMLDVWRIGNQKLVLQSTYAYGDGDITHHLVLATVSPKPPEKARKKR
ncbi:WG repeat-containing protein [Parachitinimonas caeni]|uniref:WG repeat-containing protein n=1 Tax=Parachitinimonas caeni TaxID=3031301 RepID=A0ABT7DXL3_9NEIS|nr:WG repeat-containing protein [Parachitinimonas caeni]MDK2123910.1 WG repeat-containing protein [Parachitinimonas caeni]